jgi:hypothetical protein
MRIMLKSVLPFCIFMMVFAGSGWCQRPSAELKAKVDAVVLEAYQSASKAFPCNVKSEGKPKMLDWKSIEKCFYKADQQIDWQGLARKVQEIRDKGRYQTVEVLREVESSLTAQALPYDKVFLVKDAETLLPLSNTILRSLPEESLMNLPVFDRSGKRLGTFAGNYTFEKVGEISGNKERHALFQYTDANGRMYSSSEKLLLNSYGVPWKESLSQPGFRLSVEKLTPKH